MIEERETGRPIPDLVVRAFDKDLVFDDKLGFATTDEEGRFEIRFSEDDFRELLSRRPDLFLRVYDPSGQRLIFETTDSVRWNASPDERFRIVIAASRLMPPAR